MYTNLITKQYSNAKEFQDAIGDQLYDQEILNSIFITELANNLEKPDVLCYGLWSPEETLIFALFVIKDSYLYASAVSTIVPIEDRFTVIDMLIKQFIEAKFPIYGIHAYEPTLSSLRQCFQSRKIKLKWLDEAWVYRCDQVIWNDRTTALKTDPRVELKQMQPKDIELVTEWLEAYLDDIADQINDPRFDVKSLCERVLAHKGCVNMLFIDRKPVSMAWKRRELRKGCALTSVYTPPPLRGQAYAATCVGLALELFLKDFEYVTFFVVGSQNPDKNMYTSIGCQLISSAARYSIQ